jgi:hypothetical protein
MSAEGKWAVVTTAHKGVFFGRADDISPDGKIVSLADAQMCVYWSPDVHGIVGLAATGPTKSCRITRPAPKISVTEVTAIMHATDEAVKAWQDRPWS